MSHSRDELPYIDKDIILRSQLDDRVKQAYIDRIVDLESRFCLISGDDPYDLPGCTEWRSLSARFYRDTGTEGELETLWPPGWEKEYETDLGLGNYPTAVKREPLDMATIKVEVDNVSEKISAEDKAKVSIRVSKQNGAGGRTILPIRKRRKTTAELAKFPDKSE